MLPGRAFFDRRKYRSPNKRIAGIQGNPEDGMQFILNYFNVKYLLHPKFRKEKAPCGAVFYTVLFFYAFCPVLSNLDMMSHISDFREVIVCLIDASHSEHAVKTRSMESQRSFLSFALPTMNPSINDGVSL